MNNSNLLKASFLVSLAGVAGSLFLGEVLGYPPCALCWYQRICLYPLLVLFGIALWDNDDRCWKYSLPFVFSGLAIAVYHNLLYYGIIPEAISPCKQGVSCTTRQLELLGFITIPIMSLLAFAVLAIIATIAFQMRKKPQ